MIITDIWEFFFWPIAVILVSTLIIYIVRQFRPNLKLIIDYESSFKLFFENRNYIIYTLNLINKGKDIKYNMRIESVPSYEIRSTIDTLIENSPNDPVQVIGFRDVVENPFNLNRLAQFEPGDNIQGNLIFEVQGAEDKIEKIVICYSDEKFIKRIRQNNLKILQT